VLAVNALRKAGWMEEALGLASRLEIEVREPTVKHTDRDRLRPSVWLSEWLSTGWSRSPLPWPQGPGSIQAPRPLFEFRGAR